MQPPQSVEEIKEGLETTEKGGIRQSIRNCLTVFQRDPLLSGAIAYNILTDRKDIIKPIGFHRESTALNDTDMKYLLLYLEETYGLMPKPAQSLSSIRRRSTVGNSLRSMRPTLNCTGLHKRKCALCWAGRSSLKWMC